MIYRTDYHIHTKFSDGKADPEEYIPIAIDKGLIEIGFSDHLNLLNNDPFCMKTESAVEYTSYLNELRKKEKRVIIRIGLEIDFIHGMEVEISRLINKLDLDYTIGSVHILGDRSIDTSPELYTESSVDDVFRNYFSLVLSSINSGLFNVIGHCDYVRMFDHSLSFDPEPFYREMAKAMAEKNVAFEINTNGRNRPVGDFYPDRRFLSIFREAGVPVCVNSDAHMPSRLGQFFDEAYDLLKISGYTEMCTFKNRERYLIPADF